VPPTVAIGDGATMARLGPSHGLFDVTASPGQWQKAELSFHSTNNMPRLYDRNESLI